MIDIHTSIEKMCNLPKDFKRMRTKSPLDLYKECEYEKYFKKITIDDIRSYLSKNMSLISAWIQYSEDQRCTPAWAIYEYEKGWVVELITRDVKNVFRCTFKDKLEACSFYLQMEFESLRKIDSSYEEK